MSLIDTMDRNLAFITDPTHRRLLLRIIANIGKLNDAVEDLQAAQSPEWITLVLQNSWVSVSAYVEQPQYWKDRDNWVHLKGSISTGTIADGTVIAALPADYRPARIWGLPRADGGRIEVQPGGDLVVYGLTDNSDLPLSGVFHAGR